MSVMTIAQSKPEAIGALRSTWRKSGEHAAEQVKRFLRLFILSSIPALVSVLSSGSHFDRKTLLAILVPIGEAAYRQVFPALGAAAADSAPGVTIVPDQVGLDADVPAEPDPDVVQDPPVVPEVPPADLAVDPVDVPDVEPVAPAPSKRAPRKR